MCVVVSPPSLPVISTLTWLLVSLGMLVGCSCVALDLVFQTSAVTVLTACWLLLRPPPWADGGGWIISALGPPPLALLFLTASLPVVEGL